MNRVTKQLFEKQNADYKKFNPIVFLKDILATDADETAAWILQNYCHFYVEWQGDAHATRVEIPVILRKHGVWITYDNGSNLITEQYIGDNKDIENSIIFTDDKNWQMVNKEETGVPIVDIEAKVSEVTSGEQAEAEVRVENNKMLAFRFSLPRGPQGYDGMNGKDGANGMDGKDGAGVQYIYLRNTGDVPENPTPADITSDEYQQKNHYKDIEYIPEGWSDDPVGVTLAEKYEWVCQRRYVNNVWTAFSNPTIWAKYGDQGPQGEIGPQGIPGESVLGIRTVFAFMTSEEKPETPVGGIWNLTNNTITYPDGWGPSDELPRPVWMSTGDFYRDSPTNPIWSEPTLISGEDGKNGTDGVNMEFIYKLTVNDWTTPDKPTENTPTDVAPTGWTDSPSGISEEMQCEWVCTRKKDETTGAWRDWEGPTIWSKWGANGTDGDGVEYIYKLNNGELLENPTPDDINTDEYQGKGEFVDKEYIPAGWTDEPKGVSAIATHEWVCVRKYRNNVWGKFSNPALWSKWANDGIDGYNGISIRTMYAKTESSDERPVFVKDNINPGSIWGLAVPNYEYPEAIWSISAYVNYKNELVEIVADDDTVIYGWQGPVLVSGMKGNDGIAPNYKSTFFKLSNSGTPSAPTFTDPNNPTGGWVDYPNGLGQWYQCVAIINGETETIVDWGGIIPVNGKDGVAQDGKHWEIRFAASKDYDTPPAYNATSRDPSTSGVTWVMVSSTTPPPTVPSGGAMWEIMAEINPDNTLVSGWCKPFRVSGEQGPKGDTGPAGEPGATGPTGIPGVSFEVRYCLGVEDDYDGTANPSGNSPTGWQETLPIVTADKPYIWCIQGKRAYRDSNDTTGTVTWQTPFRLSGINGIGGTGKRGQIVYPAGIYSENATYVCDENVAPYVFYPSTQQFYVLNTEMTWVGSEQSSNPATSDAWVPFESYDAIYANIAIVENGLIGSAVFNNEYMFSQQGINKSGGTSTDYQNFNASDPYNANNTFRPNWCVNLATGAQWLGAGKVYFAPDGSGSLANQNITWDSSGNFNIGSMINLFAAPQDGIIGNLGSWSVAADGGLSRKNVNGIIHLSPTNGIVIMDTNGVPKIQLGLDGSGKLAGGAISWDANGNLTLPPNGNISGNYVQSSMTSGELFVTFNVATGNTLNGTANIKIVTSDDGTTATSTKTYANQSMPFGTTVSLGNVKPNYLLLYVDDKLVAKTEVDIPDISYNTFTLSDDTSEFGVGITSVIASKFEFSGNDVNWQGANATIIFEVENTGSSDFDFFFESSTTLEAFTTLAGDNVNMGSTNKYNLEAGKIMKFKATANKDTILYVKQQS